MKRLKIITGTFMMCTFLLASSLTLHAEETINSTVPVQEPAKPTVNGTEPYISKVSYNSVKVKWKKVRGVNSYELYRSTSPNKKFKKIKSLSKSKSSYTDHSVKLNKTYYYKIRTKKTIKVKQKKKTKKQNLYSTYSSIVSAKPALKSTVLSSVKGASKTSIKLSWKKCSGAQGYEVYRCNDVEGTYKLVKRTSGRSYTNSKLPVNSTWYYKVRAYRKSGSRRIYGEFSQIKAASVQETKVSTSAGSNATSAITVARLNELFPNGIPTTAAQMEPYLTTITVNVRKANGTTNVIALRVHKNLAPKIKAIFQEMYNIGFPVLGSMNVVNPGPTYAYYWRGMTGSSKMSHHSYGCAIDINPASNPMIGYTSGTYAPYTDPYSVTPEVVAIWAKYGFYWGGNFNRAKDYMHFSYTGN